MPFKNCQYDIEHARSLLRSIEKYSLTLGIEITPKIFDYPNGAISILRTVPIAVLSEDENELLNYCNRAAEKVFGYTSIELLGMPSVNLAPENLRAKREELFQRVLKEGVVKDIETQRVHKSGNLIDIIAHVFSYEKNSGLCIAAMVERKE